MRKGGRSCVTLDEAPELEALYSASGISIPGRLNFQKQVVYHTCFTTSDLDWSSPTEFSEMMKMCHFCTVQYGSHT